MRSRSRRLIGALAIVAAIAGAAMWPVTRYVAVNRVVSEESLPLWLKVLNFVDRDAGLARTAARAVGNLDGDEARTMAALRWTTDNIRPQPAELPVRDDHVWFVVVRGYGESDQQADVFTTLLVYQGMRAFWGLIGTWPNELPLSYVYNGGAWRVFDVAHGIVFRREDGAFATPNDIAADRGLVERAARGVVPDLAHYLRFFEGYGPPETPDMLRAEMQMPSRRLVHEMKALVGMQGRVWNIRPHPAVATLGASK